MNTFVCSDIHGHFDIWLMALNKSKIDFEKGDKLIILGDLIDRGDKSFQCVCYALNLMQKYPNQVTYIMGNHERLFLDFVNIKDPKSSEGYLNLIINGQTWLGNGGTETIISFLDGLPDELLDTHRLLNKRFPTLIDQLNNLPYYKVDEKNNAVYVHAGFKPGVPLKKQDKDIMTWIRSEFFEDFYPVKNDILDGKLIVHGHTPVQYLNDYNGKGFYKGKNHICIDGGAVRQEKILIIKMEDLTYIEEKFNKTPYL